MKGYAIGMLAVVCALSVACTKKAEEPEPPEGVTAPEPSMVESVKEQAVEQVAAVKEQAAAKVEEYKEVVVSATRPLTEIKAETEKLNIDQLKATGLRDRPRSRIPPSLFALHFPFALLKRARAFWALYLPLVSLYSRSP